jgi:predicted ArsR family transcriptional regulator
MSSPEVDHKWHFLTAHSQVLLCIQRDRNVRLRDIAETVGITERAAHRILSDLIEAGYVTRTRVGRRNHYSIDTTVPMRHPAQHGYEIGELLDLLSVSRDGEGA